ncbi:hypothetical protein MAM1_0032c02453 [Mucor ambiguus]|uniref:Secreted protein n=1 Tax=Mucor ambiguus TaxID=91626 RepID=A0A0C9MM65_9FUNG|nr:hypothetical protein MAM1_0032c02453 [Mucor ambiguus]
MRSTLAIAAVAAAAIAVSAEDCNPSYNVATSGTCFTNCNVNAGNSFVSGWTMDHTSPNFISSLTLMCNKGTSEYLAFMSKAGMCMAGCPDDQSLFNNEFAGACAWWAEHKNDKCGEVGASSNSTASGSASASASSAGAAQSSASVADNAASTSAAGQTSANIQTLVVALAAGAAYFAL